MLSDRIEGYGRDFISLVYLAMCLQEGTASIETAIDYPSSIEHGYKMQRVVYTVGEVDTVSVVSQRSLNPEDLSTAVVSIEFRGDYEDEYQLRVPTSRYTTDGVNIRATIDIDVEPIQFSGQQIAIQAMEDVAAMLELKRPSTV